MTTPGAENRSRGIVVLGSTGSIGGNTLDVLAHLGTAYRLRGLAAGKNWAKLAAQAREFRPDAVALDDAAGAAPLTQALAGTGIEVLTGPEASVALASRTDVETIVAAVVGAAGLRPVIAAAERGKTIALANKEALVVAGSIVTRLARKHGAAIVPMDSEHSAIYQALRSGSAGEVRKIVLTASGGPFRTWPAERAAAATVDEALNHPNWKMGPKITIDSATLMNKRMLEVIEAHWLFDLPAEQIEVLIHPQSIIHSMIEFVDGSVIAQLGSPDMRTPIQYALTHPKRQDGCSRRLDWSKIKEMTFEQPGERFASLQLGFEVVRGGTAGAVVNAANEAANEAFRNGNIRFGQIVEQVQKTLARHLESNFVQDPTLEELLAADAWARGLEI